MRSIVKNVNVIFFWFVLFICPLLMGASADKHAAQPKTIYANKNFPNNYYLTPGQSYKKGDAKLTYKMMNIPGQPGMFDSYEQTILYIKIIKVTGLPKGLTYSQDLDTRYPLGNTFYIYGQLAADVTQGVYEVTLRGQDGAVPTNLADEIIYLHIGTGTIPPPAPVTQTPVITANLGDQAPLNLPPLNVTLANYFTTTTTIDSFKIMDGIDPATFGLSFDTSKGNFSGTYTAAGNYEVQVAAHNSGGWSSPLLVTFNISAPPAPVLTAPALTGNIGDTVPVNLPPLDKAMSAYFTSSIAIDSYKLTGGDDPQTLGLTFSTANGNFTGNYTKTGSFTVNVAAHNSAGWSKSLAVTFDISQPPVPNDQQPQLTGNVADTVPTLLPPLNMTLSSYFTSALAIDSFKIVGTTNPSSLGLTFDTTSGNFAGAYTQAGTFAVQVAAHNSAGWSNPLTINFVINQVTPSQATLLCPTVAELGNGGMPPQTFTITDSAGNPYLLTATDSSVGMLFSFYGATITNGINQSTLMCQYTSGSSVGPNIMYKSASLPANAFISSGNSCFNKPDPGACVINMTL